jgi:hypothetical protein
LAPPAGWEQPAHKLVARSDPDAWLVCLDTSLANVVRWEHVTGECPRPDTHPWQTMPMAPRRIDRRLMWASCFAIKTHTEGYGSGAEHNF